MNPAIPGPLTGVLFSGGLDSAILVARLLEQHHRVQPFYVRSGLAWEGPELATARRFLEAIACPRLLPLVVLQMPMHDVHGDHWSITGKRVPAADSPDEDVYLPGRNVLLLAKAAVWCQLHGVAELALAVLGTSPFGDASLEFMRLFQATVNCGAPAEIQVSLPFAGLDKRQVMRLGESMPLQHTFSCLAPVGQLHCGQCNKCEERRLAFRRAELPDPTRYGLGSD